MKRPAISLAFVALLSGAEARADGGVVRLQQVAGPFTITVFAPEPLRVGAADVSVLVQEHGDPVLDAAVDLALAPAGGGAPQRVRATREAATNKLLQSALVELPSAGTWTLNVDVRRGDDVANVSGALEVSPPPAAIASLWPLLALPAVVATLFAVGQWLSRRRDV